MFDLLPIKCIIVDDDEISCLHVSSLVATKPQLQLIDEFPNSSDAINSIAVNPPDLLFLDIGMPDISGVELLKRIEDAVPMVVFITSLPEYALEAFELSAFDYILKPFTEERFDQCIKRVEEYWEMKHKSNAYDIIIEQEMITIKQGHNKLRLPASEIIYLEAMNDYTKFHTERKSFITLGTLSNIMQQLPQNYFCRIHRSYAVAVNKISGMQNNKIICGKTVIPVGKTYRSLIDKIKL